VESQWILAGNDMLELSPQNVVSCDKRDGGCNGGDTISAFKWIKRHKGIASEASYPYKAGKTGRTGRCKGGIKPAGGAIKGSRYATPSCYAGACDHQDEDTLKANLASTAPASICVNAEQWQDYQKGVMTDAQCGSHSGSSLDHCVQLVGYGKEEVTGKSYWMVRNSWNTDWGVEGYIHLEMGTNTCGVANEAAFVNM